MCLAVLACAPLAPADTLYYQGGILLDTDANQIGGPSTGNFNDPDNWSTVPPNTFASGGTNRVPGLSDIAVVQADINNGTVFYSSNNLAFLSTLPAVTVQLNQTTTANTVNGFILSNYGFFGSGSGNIEFTNSSGKAFTVVGSNATGGDFVVDGGVTFTYDGGSPFNVTKGTIVIGDPFTFTTGGPYNTVGGSGTFIIASGSFDYDAAQQTTSMIVGDGQGTNNNGFFFGDTTGVVTQGAAATTTTPATASVAILGSSLTLGLDDGVGTWNVTNGSILSTGTKASSYTIILGSNDTFSTGNLNVTGGTVNIGFSSAAMPIDVQLGTVPVGSVVGALGGAGTINESGSSVINIAGTNTSVEVGDVGVGATGNVNLSGGTMNIGVNATDAVTFAIGVGLDSTGNFNQSGGTLVVGNAGVTNGTTFVVGEAGVGTYTITGGSATFNNGIITGFNGTINLDGGVINIGAGNLTGNGTLNFGGGTLNLTSGTTFVDTFAGGVLAAGTTSTINASTGAFTLVDIQQAFSGTGAINFIGTTNTVFQFNGTVGGASVMGGTLNVTAANIANATFLGVFNNGASPGVLNLALGGADLNFAGSIGGNGTLNVDFGGAGVTLFLTNTVTSLSTVNIVLGSGGTPGTLQVLTGAFGNISEGSAGNNVTIGTNAGTGAVSIGNATYTGLTTINPNYSLTATKLLGDVTNNGAVTITGVGALGGIGGNVTNTGTLVDASNIGGTLDNTGTATVAGTGIGGAVTNSGVLFTTTANSSVVNTGTFVSSTTVGTVGGDLTNGVGGLVLPTAPLPTVAGTPTFSVGGNLVSPGTLNVRIGGGISDVYHVAGSANLNGGTINVQILAGNGVGVTNYNFLTAASVSDAGTVTSPDTAIFHYQLMNNGTAETLVVTQDSIATYALTPNQQAVAHSLDSSNNPLFAYFGVLTPAQAGTAIPAALEQLTPDGLQYARIISFEGANLLAIRMDNVSADLRAGYGGLDANAISVASPGFNSDLGRSLHSFFASNTGGYHTAAPNGVNYYPGGVGGTPVSGTSEEPTPAEPATFDPSSQLISDTPNPYLANQYPSGDAVPKLSEFVGGDVVLADLNQDHSALNAPAAKASYTAGDAVVGASYKISKHLAAGVLFDYNHTDAKIDDLGSKIKVDTYSPGIFGTWFDHGFYVNGLASFGYNDYKNTRQIAFIGETATSNPGGEQYIGNIDGGYDFHPTKNLIVGPTAGVTYTHLDIDAFSESGAPGADLAVGSQSIDSLRSRFGAHAVYQTNTGDVLLQPNLSIMWQHEYLDDSDGITSNFSDPGIVANPFTIRTVGPSRDSALISLGLTATLSSSMALYLNYMADVGSNEYWAQSVVGGFKARF